MARLIVAAGRARRCRRRKRRTTVPDPEAKALNPLARHFDPQNMAIDTTWAGDIAYAAQRHVMCSPAA